MSTITKKRTVGVLGGMGPAASADMYSAIIKIAQKEYGARIDSDFPPIFIYSLPLSDWDTTGFLHIDSVKKQLIEGVKKLEKAGCDFIIMGCNTVHYLFDTLQKAVRIPIINIVEETVSKVKHDGYKTVAVLATDSSSRLKVYENVLVRENITLVRLNENQQKIVTDTIGHAEEGSVGRNDTQALKNIIAQLKSQGAEGVILGCTELPLVISQQESSLRLYNSAEILVRAALQYSYYPATLQQKTAQNVFRFGYRVSRIPSFVFSGAYHK